MRKELASLTFALFSAMFSPVHANDMKINPKIAQIQNLYGMEQDEVDFCKKIARQMTDNLRKTPYSEARGIDKYNFTRRMGNCIADEFNKSSLKYKLEKVGDEYWLRVPGVISFNTGKPHNYSH